MSTSPKFSVLMVNYNNEKYIEESIESVVLQTFSEWELLIFDDGSTDGSIEKINKFLKDERISLFHNKVNRGKVPCMKDLLDNTRSEIFGILDSDDTLCREAIFYMHNAHIDKKEYGFIYSQFEYCDNKMNRISKGFCKVVPKGETNMRKIYSSAFRTYKKVYYEKTDGYNEYFKYAQDRDMVLKMEEVTDFFFVDKILYKHRIRHNSISNNPKYKEMSRLLLIRANYDAYCRRLSTKTPNLSKVEIGVELIIASAICFRLIRIREGLNYLKLSFNIKSTIIFHGVIYFGRKILTRIIRYITKNNYGLSEKYSTVNQEVKRQIRQLNIK